MIIANGEIAAKVKSGGGLGADGYPINPSESWSRPVSCRITTNSRDNLGKRNGNAFIAASYEILIENDLHPSLFLADEEDDFISTEEGQIVDLSEGNFTDAAFERVGLSLLGSDLGEFSILWTEILDSVGAIKIVV
jgi:hypothetical protein